jgi:hypothetical protein
MRRSHFSAIVMMALVIATAAPADAAVIVTVSDTRPGELASTTPTTTLGSVASNAGMPTATYTLTALDLTSVGGGASETIVFDITYTQTGGSAPQVNGFGNISVTGGDDNQVDLGETLTATVSLNSTTFAGVIALGLIELSVGGVNAGETWDVIHDGGTISEAPGAGGTVKTSFPASSFVTLDVTDGPYFSDAVNIAGFQVLVTADVPEPASMALLGLLAVSLSNRGGLLIATRRRS